ncbi:MAG TPA: lipopolysaccharide core heptose(I) kinase RfaP [Pseudomonadales bacterium]|nr:lipopolysaccharide core heptose(I) kinase RfaP [Pseudomonadales bacterium]
MKIFLNPQWQALWQGKNPFVEAKSLQGKIYRNKEGRKTLRFERDGSGYFLKLHEGIGWLEIFKNLLQGRLPVLGAENEYLACVKLKQLRVDTMTPVAFGKTGINPARQLSFLITEELVNTVSLEDYCKTWQEHPPSIREKRAIIRKLAHISKLLHENGINHRDYYLCHFLRSDDARPYQYEDSLYLIDLHRVQMRSATPKRWLIKDLAGLFYSAFDLPLTRHDLLYFLSCYRREWLQSGVNDLQAITKRAVSLYRKDFSKEPPSAINTLLSAGKKL